MGVCDDAVPTVTLALRWSLLSYLFLQGGRWPSLGKSVQLDRAGSGLGFLRPGKILAPVGDW